MASGGHGSNSGNHSRDAHLREIAAGKRPASASSEDDPDGPLTLLDQAIELASSRRQVRQRLFGDDTSPIRVTQGVDTLEASAVAHPRANGAAEAAIPPTPASPQHCIDPAMPTPQFQELLNGPWFNPFHASATLPSMNYQAGASFLKMFQRPMKAFMALPRGFGDGIRPILEPAVHLVGDTGVAYLVSVHDVQGRLYFTHGWDRFVHGERVQPDDIGLFVLEGPNKISMRMYQRSGLEKPFSSRAVGVDPDQPPPVGANVHVPSHILGMAFELGPRVSMTSATMQQLANVWATRTCNNPLYVCVVINSHMRKKCLYFGTRFSEMLPHADSLPAAVFYGNDPDFVKGAITRPKRDKLARLSTGFGALVKLHGIAVGDTLVIRVREVDGGYRVRIFKVPEE